MKFKFNKFLFTVFLLGFRALGAMDSGDASSYTRSYTRSYQVRIQECKRIDEKEIIETDYYLGTYNIDINIDVIYFLWNTVAGINHTNYNSWMLLTHLRDLLYSEAVSKSHQSSKEYYYRIELFTVPADCCDIPKYLCAAEYDYSAQNWTMVDNRGNTISCHEPISQQYCNVQLIIKIIQ